MTPAPLAHYRSLLLVLRMENIVAGPDSPQRAALIAILDPEGDRAGGEVAA